MGPTDSAGHSKIQPEIIQNPSQNDPISEFGGGLGAHCGQSRLPNLRNSWAVLGASWGRLWRVFEHLEAATGGLEALWVVLWASLGHREGTHRKMWNLMPFERCTINRTQKRGKPKIISKSQKDQPRIDQKSTTNRTKINQKWTLKPSWGVLAINRGAGAHPEGSGKPLGGVREASWDVLKRN